MMTRDNHLPDDAQIIEPVTSATVSLLQGVRLDDVQIHTLRCADRWLDAGYDLLKTEFHPDTLDPYESYAEWTELNNSSENNFPYLMLVAYVYAGGKHLVLGAISGNVMRVLPVYQRESARGELPCIYAIGHQITAGVVREFGLKGIGTKLWRASLVGAEKLIAEMGGTLICSFLEAEDDSVGYWSHLGYRWPRGVKYWQPPLAFDEKGQKALPEVPEILMLRGPSEAPIKTIDADLLRDIVHAVYQNWSLERCRLTLSEEAYQTARSFVIGWLFERVSESIPARGSVPMDLYSSPA